MGSMGWGAWDPVMVMGSLGWGAWDPVMGSLGP